MRTSGVLLALVFASICPMAEGQNCELGDVLRQIPGFHVLKLGERDPDTRAFLIQHFAKDNPSVVHADFDGDGRPDYALLLKSSTGEAKFVIVLCPESAKLRTVYDLDVTGSEGQSYLQSVPPGTLVSQTEAIDTGGKVPRVRLRSVGVRAVDFEKAAVVLYWSSKLHKIKAIQTAD
jgi:hypothetical protein